MKRVSFAVLMIVSAVALPVWAGDDNPGDMELLEYLGSFETSNGKAVDPLLFKQEIKPGKKRELSVNRDKERKKQQKDKSELKERDNEK